MHICFGLRCYLANLVSLPALCQSRQSRRDINTHRASLLEQKCRTAEVSMPFDVLLEGLLSDLPRLHPSRDKVLVLGKGRSSQTNTYIDFVGIE